MQIRVLVPVLYSAELVEKALEEYRAAAAPGTDVSVACLANGTRTIESDLDIALAGPETMRLAVITTWNQCIPRMRRLVERNGFARRLAAVKAVNLGVLDLNASCVPRIVELSAQAVEEDGAQVVVLGCTGTGFDMAAAVEQALGERLSAYVPVIDPVKAAIKLAEACVSAGASHSKVAWPAPPQDRDEYRFVASRAAE
jgi:allantoin racemase